MLKTLLAGHPLSIPAAVIGGILVGTLAPVAASALGAIWLIYATLLKMVVLPFMVSAIIFSLRQLFEMEDFEQHIRKVVLLIVAGIALAAVVGAAAGALAGPGRDLPPETLAIFGRMVEKSGGSATDYPMALYQKDSAVEESTAGAIARQMIPDNIFASLAAGDSLKVLVFALLFGIAFGHLPRNMAGSLSLMLDTVYHACQNLIKSFNLFLPLALFAMLASQIAETGVEPLLAMTKFVVAFCLVAMLVATACAAAIMWRADVGIREFLTAFRDTLLLVFTTGSNTAGIPNTIASMVDGLRFNRPIVELLIPMGAALLRTGPALYYAMATVFVAQLYDRPMEGSHWILLVTGAFVAALASAGSTLTLSFASIAFRYVGLPFEAAFVLFIAIDRIVLIPRALLSVLSCCLVAALVSPRPKALAE